MAVSAGAAKQKSYPAMTPENIAILFRDWWIDSYGRPPGVHAELTHIGFAQHLLEVQALIQPLQESVNDPE
jgi:hypothetical protein